MTLREAAPESLAGELPAAGFGFGRQKITKETDLRIKIAEIKQAANGREIMLYSRADWLN